jgi:alkanesulfonate monooxygenase SsuD/methylene tetrahydromethanopterin reductase-like flavin-dependent oxidoreductase (luciferase family)
LPPHLQAHLRLALGTPIELPPPLDSLEDALQGGLADSPFLRGSIIGSPATVRTKLRSFLEVTQADEVMIHSMIFDHSARRRSYEIVMQIASEGISIPGTASDAT